MLKRHLSVPEISMYKNMVYHRFYLSIGDSKSSLQKAVNDTQIDQPPQPQIIKQTLKSTPQTGNFLYSLFRENRHQLSAVSDIYLCSFFYIIASSSR